MTRPSAWGAEGCKVYSLVDVDYAELAVVVLFLRDIEVNNTSMPVDLVASSIACPEPTAWCSTRWCSCPTRSVSCPTRQEEKPPCLHAQPSNLMAVEDIKRVQEVIARESKQLVYTHYNLVVAVSGDTDIQKCTNHLENSFSRMGHPHQQAGLQPVGAVRQLFPRQLLWHQCRLRPIPHPRRCRHLSDVQGAHRARNEDTREDILYRPPRCARSHRHHRKGGKGRS